MEELGKALLEGRHLTDAEAAWAEFRKKETTADLALGRSAERLDNNRSQTTGIKVAVAAMQDAVGAHRCST